jgi:DNA polymerase V
MSGEKYYITIDLKSFYASVECIERGLDPMSTNLVVADRERTEKTICLAVSPALKSYGIPGRARLFEVTQKLRDVNAKRRKVAPRGALFGSSYDANALAEKPELAVDFIAAPPQMALYMQYSTRIYQVYLKYVAPEDIHVYSIDEVFIDATPYIKFFGISARELARKMIMDVFSETGIIATAGIGTNLYLSKVAMDIVAKHIKADEHGVRIAELDEMSYRRLLWDYRPITDFWRLGRGYSRTLEEQGLYTMGDIARCSVGGENEYYNEELLYKLFGVNAELLIDHAWGYEPCEMADIKAYKPQANSIGSGQVLHCPYDYEKAKLIVREMADLLVLDLVEKRLVTNQIVLTVGYDIENLSNKEISSRYMGDITTDYYGRQVPKHAHGTENIGKYTSSTRVILNSVERLYERIVKPGLLVRRINITACNVINEDEAPKNYSEQISIFENTESIELSRLREEEELKKEKQVQGAIIDIKRKFGKNAILKGMNFEEGATTKDRNKQIGGHKA